MKSVRVDGVRLAYEERGVGPAIVLVAGGFLEMEQWDAQMASLSTAQRVIRFDQRGVGESDKPLAGYSIEQFGVDTAGLIDALDAAPCALVGSSLGGLVAIEVALRQPEKVRALILAASSAGARGVPTPRETQERMFGGTAQPLEGATAVLQQVLFAGDSPQQHPEWLERSVAKRRANPAPLIARVGPLQSALQYDPLEQLPSLRMPSLILHGAEDRLTPVENASLLAGRIPGAEVMVLAGAGHAVMIEAADEVNGALQRFLAQVDEGAA